MDFKLGGIISGMDTQTIIYQLMQVERQPVVMLENKKHITELKKGLWNEINTSLAALRTANDKLLDPEIFKKRITETSDEDVITGTADDSAAEAVYNLTITTLAKNHQIRSDSQVEGWTSGAAGAFTLSDGTATATINISDFDTLDTIAKRINEAQDDTDPSKALEVSASVINNTLVLSHDQTGSANTISFTDDSDGILAGLGLVTNSTDLAIKTEITAAQDAVFNVNGIDVTRSRNDQLTDVVSGLTLNLKTESNATLTVKKDIESAYETVKGFVDKYNSLMDLINIRLSEQTVKNPKLDVDRKKGLLRGDSTLVGIKSTLRRNISEPVDGLAEEFDRLSIIGITTTSDDFGKSGRLQIDETTFKEKVAADPEAVIQLLTNNTDVDSSGTVELSEKGVAEKINETLKSLIDSSTVNIGGTVVKSGMVLNRIESLDEIIRDYNTSIADYEERLKLREQGLWDQFTEMEKALSNLNNQGAWLSGQLAGLMQTQ